MIKRYSYTKVERYSDTGAVLLTIETEDNNSDTCELAEALARYIESMAKLSASDGQDLGKINCQVVDFHKAKSYKTPSLLKEKSNGN